MEQNEIQKAVKDCLARCYASGATPLGAIAEFVAELRSRGWKEEDIRAVEKTARRVLAGVVDLDEKGSE
jgi:hypothetical protein